MHQFAGLLGDGAQGFIQIQGGIDRAADTGERFEQHHFQPQLFIEPGVVNHPGGLNREFLQQFLIVRRKCIRAFGIHVDDAAHLALHLERHGKFRADIAADADIAFVLRHIADARRLARLRHPAGDALADAELQLARGGRKILRGVDFEEIGRGIDEHQRAGRRAHDAHGLADNELERLLRIERGMDDVADLIQQAQTLVA